MMIIAHAPISYLANEVFQKKKISVLTSSEQIIVAIASLFFGILPDFDFFYLISKGLPTFLHHDILSHFPISYLCIWLLLRLTSKPFVKIFNTKMGKVFNKDFLDILINTFLIGTLSHLLADVLVSSIMLLYPLTEMRFSIFMSIFEPNLFAGYTKSPLLGIEIIFVFLFLYSIYTKFLKQQKSISLFLKTLIAFSFIYLLFTVYVSVNTYNRSYLYDREGNIDYDVDFDTLKDSVDGNIGNLEEDNLSRTGTSPLLNSTLDIINSRKWAVGNENNLVETVKKDFGGFNSFRIISQSFYNIGLPIEPVLRDFGIKEKDIRRYHLKETEYIDLLFEYFKWEEELVELNLNASVSLPVSKVFFVVENDRTILNLGITLEGNYIALVMENDKRLQMHSLAEIKERYNDEGIKIFLQN